MTLTKWQEAIFQDQLDNLPSLLSVPNQYQLPINTHGLFMQKELIMARPHRMKLINELEALVNSSMNDVPVLEQIKTELGLRKNSPTSRQLKKRVEHLINRASTIRAGNKEEAEQDYIIARPHRRKNASKLETLVHLNMNDAAVLEQVKAELDLRESSPGNTKLKQKIDRLMRGVSAATESGKAEARQQTSGTDKKKFTGTENHPPKTNEKPEKKKKHISYPRHFLHENFEKMRTNLLDIAGGRSRLINLNQSTKSFVRLVDELPDHLVDTLLKGKSMAMKPVPEPTEDELLQHGYLEWNEEENCFNHLKDDPSAQEWAGVLGLINNYELPENTDHADDDRHAALDLQSLLYEPALNLKLKALLRDAKTAIDETGNNILFLCLGFLEWFDLEKKGAKRQAPLYMVPVKITKVENKGVNVYHLNFTSEDILPNLTLREKLKRDFDIILPDVVDPENEEKLLSPEQYFNEVNALLERKSNDPVIRQWRVRRFGTLATLSLGKLLMYLDLDPARWPNDGKDLLEHDVVNLSST